jgi:hypothetical protein
MKLKQKHADLRHNHNRVSVSFTSEQQLDNPNLNLCREDKNDTLRERFEMSFQKT